MDEIVLNSNKMTLSDSEFHWKFMNKHGKYGQQRSIFPTLFFYRITGTGKSVFRKEITFQTTFNKIQLKINFHEQNINSAPIFQNIRYYKNIIHNVLLNYSPIEEKLISTTSTKSNTGGNISKAPLINFNKVKSGNENSTSFLPVTNYFFNSHSLDNTLLNTSASIPKSTPYFLEKSVIFGSIKKSSFMNLLWNPSTRILNNYPLNLHVLNKRLFSPDSSFNTYSRKSKPPFGKLLKLISSVHPRFLNNYPILIDSSRKADFECLKTLKPITPKFIGLVYLKKDLFNAITSEDSSDGSFFVKNLHNSEKNPSLFNSYLFNYHYSKNLGQVFLKSLKTILQKSPNFASVFDIDSFDIDSSRYLANGNYFRHFPESLKRTSIFQNNIRFRHLVKKIESSPEQRKTPSPGKEVHNTGKVGEIYSYAAKKLLSPGFLHVFQAGLRYENTKLLKMKISISRNRNLTNIIDGFLEGYFQNKRNKLLFIGNPYSKKIETEDADYLQNKRNKLSFTENLYCNAVSKLALYSNWTYFSSHLKNLHGKGLKIPKSLWIPDFNYKNSKLSHHFLTVDFPVKLDSHKKLNQPKIGLLDVFSLGSKNSASTKVLARIFQMNAEYNSGHLLMETFLRCNTSFSGKKAPLIKIRNIDNEGLPDIDHPSEIAYFSCFLNIHDIYAQDCNLNSPVNPGSILRNFPKICYSENSSSFLNTLLNPRSYNVNPVFRRFRKPSPGIHTELAKYIFGKGYSGETFKSENYSSSKRGSSIKYIFKIPSYKKYSAFILNWLNSISLKNLIKLRANFHGIQASKKPGYFIETSFKADHLKKLIYNEYISTLIPFKQSSLFSRYFIGLVYLKKDLFNAITSEDSSDGSFFVKNLHNSEKNPSLFNSYLFNYHYSKNLGQVFLKSLKTILQKSPNFASVFDIDSFDIDSSRYLANGNYFRHFPESLKRTSIFQNNIRFRHLVKKIESSPEQRKTPSPGKEVHNTGKVREIYSYAAKKLLSPGFLHVFQAGLRYENTKLLKMKISISRNRNLTNIIDGFLEGYFQNKRNKLSFIGNPYSKKIFMDNPRDSKAKLPSFLSSFRYSTNNYSTKNMIPLKRKNLLLKTGPLYKISQIIASRNCNLILKHQAISGAGDSNLMFIMTKCKAENFFLERGELFGFKSADGTDYFQSENNLPVGNENLVYRSQENEITQSIAEEVQKIKKVVFDTREAIVVNSSKDTFLNNTNLKQKIDIEYISEKVSQLIGHKMKIEAERRGIL
ncbi:hypothetical protein RG963_03335 [Methanosarcina sp. Z-7115]|uniref:Uncharacterized protein n=1 Tax=Methanosarcina baikalica TaxID=3073890 RepID=A0ABU2CYP9_9EURY|nr:hypothetical protein [Methanosarcina sp. Z-7115]MDR7664833.1 hypothetical protein [Methanosarcina sp. Z-7115]